ncbi:TraM recognition domain-containing protein [Brachybacterium sp. J144]|uniref:type IV secretory system conjugative DNA transfer family protein n=1 Tax=Brachybacterium sp. J144 TaxID=3116487 RepID=UPI002E7AA944|nr:TraM recognition domain-containing protein [Brachybacterium sp. J144]MEE1652163.1 TraM recognition domain-containing protein [Brachybacterium sp. J144]
MKRPPNRLTEPGSLGSAGLVLAGVVVGALGIGAAAALAVALAPGRGEPTVLGQEDGSAFSWPVFVVGVLLLATLLILGTIILLRQQRTSSRYDYKARFMAQPRELAAMHPDRQRETSARLGASGAGDGVPLGTMVHGGVELLSSFEEVRIAIMGPRAGKTSAMVVREVLETHGPAIVTSNKRDVVDATRGPRSERGLVRVHDVQNLVGEQPTWWWNPLSFITDVESAERIAAVFAASNTPRDARADAYFSPAGRQYLSGLLLAAAVGELPITKVLTWMSDPGGQDPVALLREAGYVDAASQLQATVELTEKQRDGVVGTAAPWVSFLRNPKYLPWIQRTGPEDPRPEFNPAAFVASPSDTLYLVSKEGEGSARAITAALTMAVLDAADKHGAASPGMRLPRPLMASLDEAANVVRIPELPDLYSHYGSRGVILSVYLQSWTQGVQAWGEEGMKKMWSAANVKMVGRGVSEVPFQRELRELIGNRDVRSGSVSAGKGGRSTSRSLKTEAIFEVSELGALPEGRALLFSSGNPPAYVKLTPWWEQDYADSVTASKGYFEKVGPQI